MRVVIPAARGSTKDPDPGYEVGYPPPPNFPPCWQMTSSSSSTKEATSEHWSIKLLGYNSTRLCIHFNKLQLQEKHDCRHRFCWGGGGGGGAHPQKFLAPLQRCLAPPQTVSAPLQLYRNSLLYILFKRNCINFDEKAPPPPKYFSTPPPPNQNMKIRPCMTDMMHLELVVRKVQQIALSSR